MKKKRHIKRGTILMLIGLIMLLGAGSLAVYNYIHENEVGEKSEAILNELEQLIVKAETALHEEADNDDSISQNLDKNNAINESPTGEVSEQSTSSVAHNGDAEKNTTKAPETETTYHDPNNMEYTYLDGHYYIGVLELTNLGMSFPVQWGWSDELMDISPCRYNGNLEENNMILLAHNYSTHFGVLFNMNVGDTVKFTTVNGEVIEYQVSYIESFHRSELHRIYEGDWDLTLFTCVPNTYNRIAVRCKRV